MEKYILVAEKNNVPIKNATLRHFENFWSTAKVGTDESGTILIDLVHAQPEYLYRSLVSAKAVHLTGGGTLVGLLGTPKAVTVFLNIDQEFNRSLSKSFGVNQFVDLPPEEEDISEDRCIAPLLEIAFSGTRGEPLSKEDLEQFFKQVDPDDDYPIGRASFELYIRSELDPKLRYGSNLAFWIRQARRVDLWARDLIKKLPKPLIFVTGHLDYQWGQLGLHIVRNGGRLVYFRLDNRLPINFIDELPQNGTLNQSVALANNTSFEQFEDMVNRNACLGANLSDATDRLLNAMLGGIFKHFRGAHRPEKDDVALFDRDRPTFILFAHTFTDQPAADHGLFLSHYDWVEATLKKAAEGQQFNLLVKAHPADQLYDRTASFEALERDFESYANIRFTRQHIATVNIVKGFDAGITVRGSPGVEMVACGLPMILAGNGPYSRCNFNLLPESRDAYFLLLEKGISDSYDIERQKRRARLYLAYDRVWSAVHTPLVDAYNSVMPDDLWWKRKIEALRASDLMTDPLIISMKEAWHRRNHKLVATTLDIALRCWSKVRL